MTGVSETLNVPFIKSFENNIKSILDHKIKQNIKMIRIPLSQLCYI